MVQGGISIHGKTDVTKARLLKGAMINGFIACAEEVLLSPEVVDIVGECCDLQPAADGHALLLGMTEEAAVAPAAISLLPAASPAKQPPAPHRAGKQKAGHELMALPPLQQLRAAQV